MRVWDHDLEEWGTLDRSRGVFIADDDGDEYDVLDGDEFETEDGRTVEYSAPGSATDEAIRQAADETAETERARRDLIADQQARQQADDQQEAEAEQYVEEAYAEAALDSVEQRKRFNRTLHRDLRQVEEEIGRKLDASEREALTGYVQQGYPMADALDHFYPREKSTVEVVAHDIADQQVAEQGGMSKATANSLAAATGNRHDYSIAPTGDYDEDGNPLYRAVHDETGEAL